MTLTRPHERLVHVQTHVVHSLECLAARLEDQSRLRFTTTTLVKDVGQNCHGVLNLCKKDKKQMVAENNIVVIIHMMISIMYTSA